MCSNMGWYQISTYSLFNIDLKLLTTVEIDGDYPSLFLKDIQIIFFKVTVRIFMIGRSAAAAIFILSFSPLYLH
jgi:hypothetical protein